jgi:hypothetical protein
VFQAADAMIRALQHLDQVLCGAIDNKIEPMLLLEEIEAGSLKIWLKNALTALDDDALKKLDWRPAVGKYLVRAKYAYINWMNKGGSGPANLADLGREIRAIAAETDVKHLPDYAPPSIQDLAETTKQIENAKSFLSEGDSISYQATGEAPAQFDLSVHWSTEELTDASVRETTKFSDMPMILIVRRPDYLGTAQWAFRLGRKSVSAKIEDQEWLKAFQARRIDVRPGDALRCLVTVEHRYGHDSELIDEKMTVTKVQGVVENQASQDDLFDQQ